MNAKLDHLLPEFDYTALATNSLHLLPENSTDILFSHSYQVFNNSK